MTPLPQKLSLALLPLVLACGATTATKAQEPEGHGSASAPPPTQSRSEPKEKIDLSVLAADLQHADPDVREHAANCNNNDAEACNQLGLFYLKNDTERSLRYYRRSCQAKKPKGCYGEAWLLTGTEASGPIDMPRALELLERGCDADDRRACTMIGLQYFWGRTKEGEQKVRSIPYFQKACRAGDTDVACFNLAMMIVDGILAGSDADAADLFGKGCDVGAGLGCFNAGILHVRINSEASKKSAAELFKRGCKHKYQPACDRLNVAPANKPSLTSNNENNNNVPHPTMARRSRSKVPTVKEWSSAAKVGIAGDAGSGCETKKVREWLRVSCRGDTASSGATPTTITVDEGGKYDTYTFGKKGVTSLVTAVVPGTHVHATYRWNDGASRKLVVSWPRGTARPRAVASFVSP